MSHTIALVDDDRNILTSVSMALEAEGFKVRTYTDGAEALRGLTSQPADIAVLDIKMPRMDGMELLQRLRKQSAIPVIFLTSKDDEIDGFFAKVRGHTGRVDLLLHSVAFAPKEALEGRFLATSRSAASRSSVPCPIRFSPGQPPSPP